MSQSDTTASTRFSLLPGSITRFFLLLIVVLLVMMGVMVQSAVNTWLKDKSYQIVDITHAIHKRVDTWRYVTWQIYDNIAATASSPGAEGLQETRLKQDVYYLEKPRRKTEALIFGSHDSSTLEMTQRISTYLDTLWGAENVPWSMYYLNGQDNSLILISTLPLKDLTSGFKESTIGNIVDSRRAEMLQQANALDERESFSSLRRLAWQNGHYFTLRTTFNQPGHLATVVAFDLPINDLIPPGMPLDSFHLVPDATSTTEHLNEKESPDSVSINFNNSKIEISSALNSTDMRLVWQVPFGSLLLDTLQSILLPLLLNIALLALALFGYTTFRHLPARSTEVAPNLAANNELRVLRAINEEIVSLLPLGLLVHDQEANRTVISNKIADHLLPHLNLQNITSMAEQHQGVIQATINNELYEIRLFRSQISSRTQIFIIRDQDREVLVNKKLKQAQRLYEKNQQARAAFMQNIGSALKDPAKTLAANAAALNSPDSQKLANQADVLVRMVDEIQLANLLESDAWKSESTLFSVQSLIDDVVPEVLPAIKRKGLQLLIKNHLSAHDERRGDRDALRRILLLLIQYAVTTTQIGKITLEVDQDESETERLTFRILDTGQGVTLNEVDNLHFPFINDTQGDRYSKANPLTFWLCDQLARKLGGHLNIKAREELGTRYIVHVKMPLHDQHAESEERLLDDVCIMVDVTSNDVRSIVLRQLENWGATCITPDERLNSQEYDLFLTDNPSNLTASGLLLSDDESGVRKIGPGQLRVNFNMSNAMQEAVLELIEEQLAQEEIQELPLGGDENAELHASGYYALFVDTVPDDVKRLYTEAATSDFAALAQTAHRLKGVFAMLNLVPGKQLCEALEHLIQEKDAPGIEKYISDIDDYVKSLL
ncbi:TPA: phosphotransferase RcsD [Citrobacter braakii]|jgi:two-component system sensor histidine kinase RcsD|uniref:Phosphotransferase RcsD n=2 Tax=Citrobacter TaxID=544 RepID=A0A7Y0QSM8_CITBR|nr:MULTISPECIES: phosphotransferase RcsD [Citrobacter]KKC63509.1 phosphotransfer intermediate protein in two-component regulatory system with RcsBC [Citrobacter amalonaticus]MCW1432825.1 phosphotransferase RcsD [Citrobacter freundii]TKV32003.1 phosphotransferase RcsD [Citrobacter sp. TBCS-11]ASE42291.1 phosphotransferase RcsD [Citrobacter braakii]AUV27112.1 phosphotransferase RcsD [Citrobacter freundii complex sp. CFNIH3]